MAAPQRVLGGVGPARLAVQHAPHQLAARRPRARLHAFAQLGGPCEPAVVDEPAHPVEQEPFRAFADRLDGRRPQQVPRRTLPSAALRLGGELGRQVCVEPVRRGHPVGERLPATEPPGRGPVQLPPPGRGQVVEDRGPMQRMGEAQLGVGPRPPGHEARVQEALQRRCRVGNDGDGADQRERRGPADHGERHRQLPGGRRHGGVPGDEGGGQ